MNWHRRLRLQFVDSRTLPAKTVTRMLLGYKIDMEASELYSSQDRGLRDTCHNNSWRQNSLASQRPPNYISRTATPCPSRNGQTMRPIYIYTYAVRQLITRSNNCKQAPHFTLALLDSKWPSEPGQSSNVGTETMPTLGAGTEWLPMHCDDIFSSLTCKSLTLNSINPELRETHRTKGDSGLASKCDWPSDLQNTPRGRMSGTQRLICETIDSIQMIKTIRDSCSFETWAYSCYDNRLFYHVYSMI